MRRLLLRIRLADEREKDAGEAPRDYRVL